jgi:DNA-binding response OmpR family regulator
MEAPRQSRDHYCRDVIGPDRILVVDDESTLRELLRPYLEAEGFEVVEAADGKSAIRAMEEGVVDLVIIDVMLPGTDGFALLRLLRESSDIPVIMLTARRDEGYRVAGLRQGADDYVVKPFSVPELMARVQAQLRRSRMKRGETRLLRGDAEIDLGSRRVVIAGEEVGLTRREFDLLAALVENPNQVLSREQLLAMAWDTEFLTLKTVDVHIASLRKKLHGALKISTLRGVGYRLELT